ncbi:MAG: hypothetical protein A2391_02655 [Candidatus Brennerbacteria bacterium RIFOXYB1_FULL_41_13]|uniref:Uncharacterized protein n=1 Tax=Candidatus Brennerbacteria bacterium RIFOXYD1_FULL_41_16 TaxID=1797529 RepID=A0A1G1XMP0_9BACT|nr:MAG: hypothetical protein A2391_02655 [Candidatus Brennerbacteria bacterium RIFOXYB1_FULL_41_13]OGY40860.1 MAG: hypothetical protein A2570_00410 [Candidatus Brennerbacteria bacterium RIFOXYD1_FULL_41_16]
MVVSIKRKDNETPSSFLFRATKRIQKSGVLFETRKKRFHAKTASKAKRKVKAIHRLTIEGHMKKFLKLGYSQEESINMARRILKGITRE